MITRLSTLVTAFALLLGASAQGQVVTLYETDFTDLTGWTVTVACDPDFQWAADATPAGHFAGPFVSPPASLNFNDGFDIGGPGGHGGGALTCGKVTSDPIDLSVATGTPRLRFLTSNSYEGSCDYDVLSLRVLSAANSAVHFEIACFDPMGSWLAWEAFEYPLDPSWGAVRIEFEFRTIDGWGNEGSGPFIDDLSVVDGLPIYTTICEGDGSGTPCPCGNTGASGSGCANSTGVGAVLAASGSEYISAGDLALDASQLRPHQFGTFLQGTNALNGGHGIVFGAGLRCAGGSLIRLQQVQSDAAGSSNTSIDVALKGNVSPGDTRFYQLWYRDPLNGPCSSTFNLTNGIVITWLP